MQILSFNSWVHKEYHIRLHPSCEHSLLDIYVYIYMYIIPTICFVSYGMGRCEGIIFSRKFKKATSKYRSKLFLR